VLLAATRSAAAVIDPLHDAPDDPVTTELRRWLAGSTRFRAFFEVHAPKIRKKLRGAGDPDARRDVRAELRAAHLLLADHRISLAFEAYGARKGGPDFTVTFRGERAFNLEVTRLRRPQGSAEIGSPILTKLHQLPPSVPNALVLSVPGAGVDAVGVEAAMRDIRSRADRKDEAFFLARGFAGSRAFYERFLRLGAVMLWCEEASADSRAALWVNRSARIAVPERAVRACVICFQAG